MHSAEQDKQQKVPISDRRTVFSEDLRISTIAEIAKKKAIQVKLGGDSQSIEDHLLALKHWWSSFYKRPMKDPILEEYDLYELYLEFYLHTLDKEEITKIATEENKEELDQLFNDFEEEDRKFIEQEFPEMKQQVAPQEQPENSWSMSEKDFA